MDYGRGASNAIAIIPDAAGPEAWAAAARGPTNPEPAWATDDDYRSWPPGDPSSDAACSAAQSRAGSEQPPNKKARGNGGESSSTSRSKAIGRMFFKTKLCCKFRAGTCPYPTNCNFAHGIEELRKPPANWEEIVAAHQEGSEPPPREEHQIPIISSSGGAPDGQRSYKGRHCKKFYTEEGCPYGEMCTFLHDEQSRARESVAISLSPAVGGGGLHGNVGNGGGQKPSNWKTRICNKWEMTGYCPFGSKCHFAHGATELHKFGGGLVDSETRDAASAAPDSKQAGGLSKSQTDTVVGSSVLVGHVDIYHMGVPSQRSTSVNPRLGQRPLQKWKGPDKISKIYGDWIDDLE